VICDCHRPSSAATVRRSGIDFENAKAAAEIFEEGRRLNSGSAPVTVALVAERAKARDILSGGAHFVLYKPLSEEKAPKPACVR
jgi:hypothetical protein